MLISHHQRTGQRQLRRAEVAEGATSASERANRAGPAVDISLNDSAPADVCVDLEADIVIVISISRVVVVVAIGGVSLAAAGPWR